MLKPQLLRAHLTAANPDLQENPERLQVFADKGRLVATGAASLSHEYRYTLTVILTDYAGESAAVMVPLLAWVRVHQPDLVNNADMRDKGIRFEVEFIDQQTVDLSIELDLTERVIVRRMPERPGALEATHIGEPPDPSVNLTAERWDLYVRDDLVARWDIAPYV